MYPWVGVSMAQDHGVSLLPTGLATLGHPARPAIPLSPASKAGRCGLCAAASVHSAQLSYHPLPPQQLPDLPPHLPPAQPPRRPHPAGPLQRHLWQPRPGDRHAQLPWAVGQGHKDHGESKVHPAVQPCLGSSGWPCSSVTQAAPWLLLVGPDPQYYFPGELVGNADPQAPPGPAKRGPAGDSEHV